MGKRCNSKNSRGKKYKGGIIVAKRFLKERIYELFKEGKKRKEIASILKISRTTVCNYLNNTAELKEEEEEIYKFIKECSVKAKSDIIDLKLENCYQADVLGRLQQNNLLLILSFEKEKIQRIKLLEVV